MSQSIEVEDTGYDAFSELLEKYSISDEKALDAVESGAQEFKDDLLKLPRPRSKINKSGYTHLVDSFAFERKDGVIKVGWGKYYGPMLEKGTKKMAKQAHLKPTFNQDKDKYYKKMIEQIF